MYQECVPENAAMYAEDAHLKYLSHIYMLVALQALVVIMMTMIIIIIIINKGMTR